MGDIFEQYGDVILSIIAGIAFLLFLMQLVFEDGMLLHVINDYENTICVNLLSYWKGGM